MDEFWYETELRKRVLIKEMLKDNIRIGIVRAEEKEEEWFNTINNRKTFLFGKMDSACHDVGTLSDDLVAMIVDRECEVLASDCLDKSQTINTSNESNRGDASIMKLLGRPIMTEEERLYRKILRRHPKKLKLAALKELLCD